MAIQNTSYRGSQRTAGVSYRLGIITVLSGGVIDNPL
jgi:hypothetical protein